MLRDYQQEAVEAIIVDIVNDGASVVVMPTGAGKSHVIAEAVARLDSHVLILQPSRELLAQNKEKLERIVGKESIGVYSASFNSREIKTYTFATIQSVYKVPHLFRDIPYVFMDECALYPVRSLSSMYSQFFAGMGNPKIYGLTATPYRIEQGYERIKGKLIQSTMLKMITRARHKSQTEQFWKRIIYSISHRELVKDGYLVPIRYVHEPIVSYESVPVNKSRSDYDLDGYVKMIVGKEALAIRTVEEAARRHGSVLVFCSTVEQAQRLSDATQGSTCVFGTTEKKDRESIIDGFKDGSHRVVYNVGCLTTGFDHPSLDAIVLLRPLRSPMLYNQIIGRLTRPASHKTEGVVYDLTGTCKALGPIEEFEIYQNRTGLWDLASRKRESWNNRVLYKFELQGR